MGVLIQHHVFEFFYFQDSVCTYYLDIIKYIYIFVNNNIYSSSSAAFSIKISLFAGERDIINV